MVGRALGGTGRRSGRAWYLSRCRAREVAFGFWTEGLSPFGSQARPDLCFLLVPSSSFPGTCQIVPSPHSPAGSQRVHGRGGVGDRGCSRDLSLEPPLSPPFSRRAHTCIAVVPSPSPPSPLDLPPEGQWQKGGGRNRNDDDFDFSFCRSLGRVVVLLPGPQRRILCQTIISALSLLSDALLTAQGRLLNGHQTSASIPSIVIKLGR